MLLVIIVSKNQDNGITRDFVIYLCSTIVSFVLFVFLTVIISQEIQFAGVQKYLDKEIVIEETTIKYDSQNQPIDTTYTFKYNR